MSDWEHLKPFGYAPGGYMSRCRDCGVSPIMDKRATRCRPCAELAHAKHTQAGATALTDDDIKTFASQHAPKLAENITRLCGQVIARGIQGHLEHACALQQQVMALEKERDALKASLQRIATWDEHSVEMSVDFGSNGVRDYYRRVALDALGPGAKP